MKRGLVKRIAALATCLVMVMAFSPAVMAKNVCKQISGTSKAASTFEVETGSRWYSKKDVLKLQQTKGTMKITTVLGKNKTKTMYETYTVKVQKIVNGKVTSTKCYKWTGKTLKLKLDKNSTYRVTVTSMYAKYKGKYPGGTLFNPYDGVGSLFWSPRGWSKHSTWKVSSTSGILSCN